jgi:hypothetical protein
MTGRYIYCPMTSRRLGWHLNPVDRIRQAIRMRRKRKNEPDVFPIVGCFAPIFPGK